jgi:hypothetical protein
MPDVDPTGASAGFSTMFGLVAILVALGLAFGIGSVVYRSVHLTRRGVNPLTLREDLATQALRSGALAPARSKSDRLDELDLLRSTGRISESEHAAARTRILAE